MSEEKVRVPLTATLGLIIKEHRQKLGLSQEELAQRASLHRTYISNIEQGERNPSLTTLSSLAAALQLDCSTLMLIVEHKVSSSAASIQDEQQLAQSPKAPQFAMTASSMDGQC